MTAFVASSARLELLPPPRTAAGPPCLVDAEVVEHRHVTDRYWLLRLHAPQIAATARPGQFLMLTIAREASEGPVLPRPMAIYTADPNRGVVDVMYGVVGAGTRLMTTFEVAASMAVVGPLGRGFDLGATTRSILLVGRGIGTCSLTMLAFEAQRRGVQVTALDSARTAHALVADAAYQAAGVRDLLQVLDSDGTSEPAAVRALLEATLGERPPQQIYTCGSSRLAELSLALGDGWDADVQVSLEAHMACGLGYCHGCASGQRVAAAETPLICKDGPVFRMTSGNTQA